ncbi:MAG: tRNA pseudouridine(55) synthase TruB [Bacteroidota bacterium]
MNSPLQEYFSEGQVLLVDKPLEWTSHDVVAKIRNAIRIKKVGHAGTLDPLATGLLILCTGKFTKRINEFMSQEKEYTGTITLGAETPTYDLESDPQYFKNTDFLNPAIIDEAVTHFIGEIDQIPPIHSAIKQKGKPVYLMARKGHDVKLEPRKIFIKAFEITSFQRSDEHVVVSFMVVCSTGTYIRSLAHDLGQFLGCGGYLSSLRRTRIGEYSVEDAQSIEEILERIHSKFRKDS